MLNGEGDSVPRWVKGLAWVVDRVGFPIVVAAFLLYELRPLMLEQVRQQAVMISQLQGLGARSCTLPFTRELPAPVPPPALPAEPGAFRGLGLRHARPVEWSGLDGPCL